MGSEMCIRDRFYMLVILTDNFVMKTTIIEDPGFNSGGRPNRETDLCQADCPSVGDVAFQPAKKGLLLLIFSQSSLKFVN